MRIIQRTNRKKEIEGFSSLLVFIYVWKIKEQIMKTITKLDWIKLKSHNCDKGKHRLRTNKFGITWCTICGNLSTSIGSENLEKKMKN